MQRKQITNRPSYLKAHKEYDELHGLLGNLTGKLSDVSKHVDKEFLASYRVHMLSIQSEIKSLREDVEKGVQALKSDGNVAKLEMEVNWFVGMRLRHRLHWSGGTHVYFGINRLEECTRLRLHYTTMENDCLVCIHRCRQRWAPQLNLLLFSQQMQSRFKAMLEQKTYMNEQLKAILKRNRVLEVGVTPL
jgi:hypothetical protein